MTRRAHDVIQGVLSGLVLLSATLVFGVLPAISTAAHAQPLTVQWDSLGGDPVQPLATGIAVRPEFYGDTLFATSRGDLFRLLPDEASFGPEISETNNPGPGTGIEITEEGYLLTEDGRVSYSTDGGVRWADATGLEDMGFAQSIHQTRHPASSGVVLAGGSRGSVWVSDDGTAWTRLFDFGSTGFRSVEIVYDLLGGDEMSAPWAGRLLAGFIGFVRYSDDGGQTWTDATGFPFLQAQSIAEAPDGTLYLTAENAVLRSRDGGASWQRVHTLRPEDWDVALLFGGHLAVAPDGTVWLGIYGRSNETDSNGNRQRWGTFAYSTDEGATWTEAATGYTGRYQVNDVLIDGRGRLVAATFGGVWRTRASVVVASEDAPPGKPGETTLLGVPYPNPTQDAVTVPLTLTRPAEVRVTVVDLLGREVAVLTEGPQQAGRHALALDTASLAPGLYVVRATVDAAAAETRRFSVVR
ncbi:MAG: T9SS type A sorting domain-containing protein [Bacteroidota bacterium]